MFCKRTVLLTLATLVVGVLAPLHAQAQTAKPKVGDAIGAWTFQCQALSADQTICALVQAAFNKKTKAQLLRAVVRYTSTAADSRLGLFVTLPLGIHLAPGIVGRVDKEEQFKFTLQNCRTTGCEAAVEIDTNLERAMKVGKQLIVGFKATAGGDTVAVPISLSGFTKGLGALGTK